MYGSGFGCRPPPRHPACRACARSGVGRVDLDPQAPGRSIDRRPARRPARCGRRHAPGSGRPPSPTPRDPSPGRARRRTRAPPGRAAGRGHRTAAGRAASAPGARPRPAARGRRGRRRPAPRARARGSAPAPDLRHPGRRPPGRRGPGRPVPPPPRRTGVPAGAGRCRGRRRGRRGRHGGAPPRCRRRDGPDRRRHRRRSPSPRWPACRGVRPVPRSPGTRRSATPSTGWSHRPRTPPVGARRSAHRRVPHLCRPGPRRRRTGCIGPAPRRSGRPGAGCARCGAARRPPDRRRGRVRRGRRSPVAPRRARCAGRRRCGPRLRPPPTPGAPRPGRS